MSRFSLQISLTGWAKCTIPLATVEQPNGSTVTVLDDGKTVASADQIKERLDKIDN